MLSPRFHEQPCELKGPELLDLKLEPIPLRNGGEPPAGLLERLPIQKPRHAENPRHRRHVDCREQVLTHQCIRLSEPEEPAPEVSPCKSLGRDVVVYDNQRIVVAVVKPASHEPSKDVFVFPAYQRVVDLAKVGTPPAQFHQRLTRKRDVGSDRQALSPALRVVMKGDVTVIDQRQWTPDGLRARR